MYKRNEIIKGMPALGRGSAIVSLYACENCGGVFATVQRFHKGEIFVGKIELEVMGSCWDLPMLWRD